MMIRTKNKTRSRLLLITIFALLSNTLFASTFLCHELLDRVITQAPPFSEKKFAKDFKQYLISLERAYSIYASSVQLGINQSLPIIPPDFLFGAAKLTQDLYVYLKELNIDATLVTNKIEIIFNGQKGVVTYPTIHLKLTQSESLSHGLEMLGRIQKKIGITETIIDPLSTFEMHARAFFYDDKITASLSVFVRDLLDDIVGSTMIHEMNHGMFELMRREGKRVIYSNVFMGDLTKYGKEGYAQFFSFEELYTFGRQLFTLAQEMPRSFDGRTIKQFDPIGYFEQVNRLTSIASKADGLSNISSKTLDQLAESDKVLLGTHFGIQDGIFTSGEAMIIKINDLYHGSFLDPEKKVLFNNYISPLLNLINMMEEEGIQGGLGLLNEVGIKAIKFADQEDQMFALALYEGILANQKKLIDEINLEMMEYNELAISLKSLGQELNNEASALASLYDSITATKKIDKNLLQIFNERYQVFRKKTREVTNLLIKQMQGVK